MALADVEKLAEIEKLCFASPWSASAFREELSNVCARYLVAEKDGVVVGYGGMWLILTEAHITNVAVLAQYRGKGYGKRLLQGLMRLAYDELGIQMMTLEVRKSNAIARSLYETHGFRVEGVRPHYYENNGEDALIMWCPDTRTYCGVADA